MPKFLTTLQVEKQPDGQWKLLQPLRYETEQFCPSCCAGKRLGEKGGDHDFILEAQKDFITDFASIPQFAQNLISNDGPWDAPAVIHDLGYRTQPAGISRAQWDAVLLEACKAEKVCWWKRTAIYLGVRCGGWLAWKNNKAKLTGKPPTEDDGATGEMIGVIIVFLLFLTALFIKGFLQ